MRADHRPTPEELVNDLTRQGAFPTDLMDVLGRFGYVIVHPDDVPLDVEQGSGSLYANAYGLGWNNCHRRIFATAEQGEHDKARAAHVAAIKVWQASEAICAWWDKANPTICEHCGKPPHEMAVNNEDLTELMHLISNLYAANTAERGEQP